MDLEGKVELLAGEIALMKEELGGALDGLRELLNGSVTPSAQGASKAAGDETYTSSGLSASTEGRGAPAGAPMPIDGSVRSSRDRPTLPAAERGTGLSSQAGPRTSTGGGLSLSQGHLDLILGEARIEALRMADGGKQRTGRVTPPLERLARTVNESRSGRTADHNGGNQETLTLSLSELARMLKDAQAGDIETAGPSRRKGTRSVLSLGELARKLQGSNGSVGQTDQIVVDKGVAQTSSLGPATLGVMGPQACADEGGTAVAHKPSVAPRPMAARPSDAPERPASAPSVATDPTGIHARSQSGRGAQLDERPAEPKRMTASKRSRDSHPLGGYEESDDRLDVNLVASLMRWVDSVSRGLGVQNMADLLETYRPTGHLTPEIAKIIMHLASFSALPDELPSHRSAEDDLSDALIRLHGIIYGSGRPPAGQTVDINLTEIGIWADSEEGDAPGSPWVGPLLRAEEEVSPDASWEKTSGMGAVASESGWRPAPSGEVEEVRGTPSPSRSTYLRTPPAFLSAASPLDVPTRDGRAADPRAGVESPIRDEASPTLAQHLNPGGAERPSNGRRGVDELHGGHREDIEHGAAPEGDVRARNLYPSDVTNEEWRWIEPLIPGVKPGGRPSKYARREILNGILYQGRTGCSWRSLPHDLPSWKIVHHYYRVWRGDGTWQPIAEALTGQRRDSEPSGSESEARAGNGLLSPHADMAGARGDVDRSAVVVVPRLLDPSV